MNHTLAEADLLKTHHIIKRYQDANNLTANEACTKVGVSPSMVSKIMKGEINPIHTALKSLDVYAKFIGEDKSSLLKLIAEMRDVDLPKAAFQTKYSQILSDKYEVIPDTLRRSLLYRRVSKVKEDRESKRSWVLKNTILMLLMDLDDDFLFQLLKTIEIVHRNSGKKLSDNDKECIDLVEKLFKK